MNCENTLIRRDTTFVPIRERHWHGPSLSSNGEAEVRDTLARIKPTFPDAPVVISRRGAAAA